MQREMGQSFLEGSSKTEKTVNPMTHAEPDAAKETPSAPKAEPQAPEPPEASADEPAEKASG